MLSASQRLLLSLPLGWRVMRFLTYLREERIWLVIGPSFPSIRAKATKVRRATLMTRLLTHQALGGWLRKRAPPELKDVIVPPFSTLQVPSKTVTDHQPWEPNRPCTMGESRGDATHEVASCPRTDLQGIPQRPEQRERDPCLGHARVRYSRPHCHRRG